MLHDIGKLGVPVAILQKPGALDPAERAAIERHPALGAAMLDQLGGFGPDVRSLVLDHHERPDGAGYPRGLSGHELSLDAQDPRGLRRLRRARLGASLPRGMAGRARAGDDRRRSRDAVRRRAACGRWRRGAGGTAADQAA